jgi:hypothetical protein
MSTVKGLRAGVVAGILGGMALLTGPIRAYAQDQFSTERPASILIFPKVINTGVPGPETVIQISNTTNMVVFAHCLFVDGRSVNGAPSWAVTDFDLTLTRQQPTHWAVSAGRAVDPMDSETGLDPGLIPPVSDGFMGFLTCVQVDSSGAPVGGNALKGEATIGNVNGVDGVNNVSKYNAIGIPAVGAVGPGNTLHLDGVEYAACPADLLMNFQAENGPDPALETAGNTASIVSSDLTVVPCGMDFENLIPGHTTLDVHAKNEFEENSSASFSATCWRSLPLSDPVFVIGGQSIFNIGSLNSEFGTAVLSPAPGQPPALGVLNVLRIADDGTSDTASSNLFWNNPASPNPTPCPVGSCGATCDLCASEILLPCTGDCGLPPPTPTAGH